MRRARKTDNDVRDIIIRDIMMPYYYYDILFYYYIIVQRCCPIHILHYTLWYYYYYERYKLLLYIHIIHEGYTYTIFILLHTPIITYYIRPYYYAIHINITCRPSCHYMPHFHYMSLLHYFSHISLAIIIIFDIYAERRAYFRHIIDILLLSRLFTPLFLSYIIFRHMPFSPPPLLSADTRLSMLRLRRWRHYYADIYSLLYMILRHYFYAFIYAIIMLISIMIAFHYILHDDMRQMPFITLLFHIDIFHIIIIYTVSHYYYTCHLTAAILHIIIIINRPVHRPLLSDHLHCY